VEGCGPINEYYVNKGKKAAAEKNRKRSWPRNTDVCTQFCWTYVALDHFRERQNEPITFPKPWELTEPLTAAKCKTLLDNIKKARPGKYQITLELQHDVRQFTHETSPPEEGLKVIRLAAAARADPEIIIPFTHKLQARLDQVSVRPPDGRKARNIYGIVSLRDGTDELAVLRSRWTNTLSKSDVTRCWYHTNKVAVFDELFVFDLPIPVSPKLTLVVDFYHLVAKQEKTKIKHTWIGKAVFPLFVDDQLVPEGSHQVSISYCARVIKAKKPDPASSLTLQIAYKSSLITPEPGVAAYFRSDGVDSDRLETADVDVLIRHLFRIFDMAVAVVPVDAARAVRALCHATRKVVMVLKEKLPPFMDSFAQCFGVRNREIGSEFHRKLMDGWSKEIIANEAAERRPDRFIVDFLFTLIIKSLALTGDTNFSSNFWPFILAFTKRVAGSGREDNKACTRSFARFINMLFDINLHSQAIQACSSQCRAFLVTKNPLIEIFLGQVFGPKFFYVCMYHREAMPVFDRCLFNLIAHGMEIGRAHV
jgi:hypothetical protein